MDRSFTQETFIVKIYLCSFRHQLFPRNLSPGFLSLSCAVEKRKSQRVQSDTCCHEDGAERNRFNPRKTEKQLTYFNQHESFFDFLKIHRTFLQSSVGDGEFSNYLLGVPKLTKLTNYYFLLV